MPRLPRLTARQIITALETVGFSLARQSGSHMIYKNSAGKRVTVPFHASKILHPKLLKSICETQVSNPKLSKICSNRGLLRTAETATAIQ
jgi:predicted RNA binding protein YcfA (HicA-like mRNA interferase family)